MEGDSEERRRKGKRTKTGEDHRPKMEDTG